MNRCGLRIIYRASWSLLVVALFAIPCFSAWSNLDQYRARGLVLSDTTRSPDSLTFQVAQTVLNMPELTQREDYSPRWWLRFSMRVTPDTALPRKTAAMDLKNQASAIVNVAVNKSTGSLQHDYTGVEMGFTASRNGLFFNARARSGEDTSRFIAGAASVKVGQWLCVEIMGEAAAKDSVRFLVLVDGHTVLDARECLYTPAEFVATALNPVNGRFPGQIYLKPMGYSQERPKVIPHEAQGCSETVDTRTVLLQCLPYESEYEGEQAAAFHFRIWRMPDTAAPYFEEMRDIGTLLEQYKIKFPLDSGVYLWSARVRNNFGWYGPWSARRSFAITRPKLPCVEIDSIWFDDKPTKGKWVRTNIRMSVDGPWYQIGYLIVALHSADYAFGNPGNKGGRFLARDNYVANIAFQKYPDSFSIELKEKVLENSFSSSWIPDTAQGLFVDPMRGTYGLDTLHGLFHCRLRLPESAGRGPWSLMAYCVSTFSDSADPSVERYSAIYRKPVQVFEARTSKNRLWNLGFLFVLLCAGAFLAVRLRKPRNIAESAAGPAVQEKNFLVEYLTQNLHREEMNREIVMTELKISRVRFYELLGQAGKESLPLLVNELRMQKAMELLKDEKLIINQIAYQVGFSNPSYFNKVFKAATGKTPLEFRESVKIK